MKQVCRVRKQCGGCRYMGTAYVEQLNQKRKYVQSLFPKKEVDMVIGMEDPFHYRNKVYAAFGYDRNQKLIAGMYEENSHDLVFEKNCLIQNETANRIVASLCDIAQKMKIEPYNEDTGWGVLRHAYLRVSHETGKVLLVIVIGSRELPGSKHLVQELVKANPEIETIVLNKNSKETSMVLGDWERVLYGPGFITDTIGGLQFRISSRSFYQVNPVQTEKLYAKAIEMAQINKTTTVLDACCGIGTISLLAAKRAKEVVGVEINEAAIKDAEFNAKKNNIQNVQFFCDDAENFLDRLLDKPDIVLLDPPRAGVGKRFMQSLAKMGPKRIVYISCNPKTQAEDVKEAMHNGYAVKQIVPVDLFPFTNHVETVVLLSKMNTTK